MFPRAIRWTWPHAGAAPETAFPSWSGRATAAVWDAARAIDEAGENPASAYEFAAAVAATLAPAAAQHCTQDCIQVHGGIGFTWESDCQFFYRRARLLSATLGSKTYWADRLVGSLEQRNSALAA